MKKIATLVGREIKWTQPRALKMEYELRVGDEIAATLRFRSSFKTNATAESADGCWTFNREGILRRTVTVRACDSNEVIGVFMSQKWNNSGTIELGGRTYKANGSVWGSRYWFSKETGEMLVELKHSGWFHHSAKITLHLGAARDPQLPLLVMLGWYLDVLMQNDAEVAAAV